MRSLPESVSRATQTVIPFYDSGVDPARFGGMRLAKDREILAFKGGLDAAWHNRFEHDPRLDVVADLYARSFRDEESLPNNGLVEWAMRRLGIAGRIVDLSLWWSGQQGRLGFLDGVLRRAAADLPKELGAPPGAESYTFGVSRFKGDSWRHFQAHVVVENGVRIEALPKAFPLGEEIVIRGRLAMPHKHTTFTMMFDGADSFNIPVKTGKDGRFEVRVPPIEREGRYFIEMRTLAEPARFVAVLKLPVYVGVAESETPDDMITDPPENPADMGWWPRRVAQVMNERRALSGLQPLLLDERASAVARQEAAKDAEHWYAPMVPAREALGEAGIVVSKSDEIWSSFELLEEMLWGNLQSPWFRGAVLDDRYTRLGVGFAKVKESHYSRYIGITYLFADAAQRDRDRSAALALFDREIDDYGGPGRPARPAIGYAAALEAALDAATEVPIAHDAGLDTLAEAYGRYGDLDLDDPIGQWMLWKLGETGQLFRVERRVVLSEGVNRFSVAEVKAAIEQDDESSSLHYAFGVARTPQAGGALIETVVVVSREIELTPFPKRYRSGEKIVISGRFTSKPKSARFMMNFPEGRTISADIDLNEGASFGYSTIAPSAPGRYMIEISVPEVGVEDEAVYFSRHSALFVPVWIDAEEPASPAAALLAPERNPLEHAEWGDSVAAIYDSERAACGLPLLRRNRVADAVLADQMLLEKSTLHTPTFREMQGAVGANGAGYATSVAGNADFFDNDLLANARRLLQNPAWREEILSPRTTMLGFAVSEDGYRTLQMLLADESEESSRRPAAFTKGSAAVPTQPELPPVVVELNGEKLADVAKEHLKDVGNCFNEVAQHDEDFGGRITFGLAVGSLGDVVAVTLESSTINAESVEICIAKAIRGWKFPLSVGRGVGFGSLGFELVGKGERRKIRIL